MPAYIDGVEIGGNHALLTNLDYPSSAHTGFANYHGFVNWTDSTLVWTDSSPARTFTISPTSSSYTYYTQGKRVDVTSSQSVQIPNTPGLWGMYFDANGVLSTSYQTYPESTAPDVIIALVWWTGITGFITEERHHYDRNLKWHEWAHDTIGCRWQSGIDFAYDGTGGSTTFATTPGVIFDEDNQFDVPSSSSFESPGQGRLIYQTGSTTFDYLSSMTLMPFLWNYGTSRVQYVNSSGYILTDLTPTQYTNVYVYATEDYHHSSAGYGNPITFVIETVATPWISTTAAESAEIPSLQGDGLNPEMKLLWRLIVRGDGVVSEVVDERTQSFYSSGGTKLQIASQVSFEPHGLLTETDVQNVIQQLDDQFSENTRIYNDEISTSLLWGGTISITSAKIGSYSLFNTSISSSPISFKIPNK